MSLSNFVTEEIERLVPYAPGKSIEEIQRDYGVESVIKLASNENPLGPSPKVIEAIQKAAQELHRYPDGAYYETRQALSKFYGIPQEGIVLGNGSNELIDLLVRVFCRPGDRILTTQAAFIAYKISAQTLQVKTDEIPLTEEFAFDIDALERFIEADLSRSRQLAHKVIFLPNPNNPTGVFVGRSKIERFLKQVGNREDVLVVLDEAYTEFVRSSESYNSLEWLPKYKNLIVLRTFSKAYGLAGLRVGAMLADPKLCDYVQRVRMPFNVNLIAQAAVEAAIEDQEYLRRSQEVTWQGLDYLYEQFNKMGLKYAQSEGNFVFFDTGRDAGEVNEALLRRGVILRPLKGYGFPQHLRMSIGTAAENQRAVAALKEILGN